MANLKFLDFTGLGEFKDLMTSYIDAQDAATLASATADSIKGVAISEDGKKLLFYKDMPMDGEGVSPAYEIELPETDLSGLMEKFESATAGHVVTVASDGKTIIDSGVALTDLATVEAMEAVEAKVDKNAEDISALDEKMGELPSGTSATNVIDYVNIKTAGIATDSALEELNNQVSGLQTAVQDIQKDYLVEADKTALQEQIDTNKSAIELLTNGVDAEKVDGVNDLIKYVEEHGAEVTGMKEDISDNADAIAVEAEKVATLQTEMDTVEGKIATLEETSATHALKTDLDAAVANIEKNAQAIAIVDAALKEGGSTYQQIQSALEAGQNAQSAVDSLSAYVGNFVCDDESITTVCQYIDYKANAVVVDIEARLKAVEDAVDAINDAENGILAQSKAYTDELANGQVATNKTNIENLQATVDGIESISQEEIKSLFSSEEA